MLLVVNPNNRLRTSLAAIEPPLWAGLCASFLGADILDAEAEDLTLEETESRIRAFYPNAVLIVVMGNNPSVSSTPKMPVAEALADRIKDLNVSFTGIHPIAVNYQKYPVIKYPFDGFPMMPWDKLPMHLYKAHNWHCLDGSPRTPYASIYTSLGCPFDCYYCPIHTLYGDRRVKFRPVKDVLKEVDILTGRYGVRNIKIWDELFALNEDRVLSICSGLRDYNLNIWAYARVDTVTERMLGAMKKAGINWLAYGFESVTDPKFIKRTAEVINMTRDAGINIMANFMFGLPGATIDDDRRSLDWAKSQLFEFVNFYDAMPYPGSQWFEDVKPLPDWSLNPHTGRSFSQYICPTPFRRMAFKEYFTNPEYLGMIRSKFGVQGEEQIKEMLSQNDNARWVSPVR